MLFPLAASAAVTPLLPWTLGDKHSYQSVAGWQGRQGRQAGASKTTSTWRQVKLPH
ncbi:MAG: hypothetical protein H7147_06420 [Frankiaceae bacterium]|nr:hypothetical protein [Arenimonas sp.]